MLMQVMPLSAAVLYVWLLPESPRWLARKGNKERALKVRKNIILVSKVQLSVQSRAA